MTRFTAHDLVREIEHELGGELTAYQQYQIQCEAKKLFPNVVSLIDKLAKKNVIHKNKASNLKSKLSKLQ